MFTVTEPKVAILLATKNGAQFLSAQLDSLAAQTLPVSRLLISDDNSTDDTVNLLDQRGLSVMQGPDQGAAQNFLYLLRKCPPDVHYAAFCDQDDVWHPEKLARSVSSLKNISRPALYGARVWVTDSRLNRQRLSPLRDRRLGFAHALVECFAGGNSMMLNRQAIDIAQHALKRVGFVATHDWWIYQLITGCGGVAVFDHRPCLLYRQHGGNLAGSSAGLTAGLRRVPLLFQGQWRKWNDSHVAALNQVSDMLTPESRRTLQEFEQVRLSQPFEKLCRLQRLGAQRSDFNGRLALAASALCGQF